MKFYFFVASILFVAGCGMELGWPIKQKDSSPTANPSSSGPVNTAAGANEATLQVSDKSLNLTDANKVVRFSPSQKVACDFRPPGGDYDKYSFFINFCAKPSCLDEKIELAFVYNGNSAQQGSFKHDSDLMTVSVRAPEGHFKSDTAIPGRCSIDYKLGSRHIHGVLNCKTFEAVDRTLRNARVKFSCDYRSCTLDNGKRDCK